MFIVWRHHSPGTSTSDVHSVRWLRTRPACAILGLGQPKRLIHRQLKIRAPLPRQARPTQKMRPPSFLKEARFIQGSGVFRVQRRLFVSTQTEAPPVVRTHLRPTEIAARTGLSKSAVFHALHTGSLRATRVGRAWLISTAAIDEWLDDRGRHAA